MYELFTTCLKNSNCLPLFQIPEELFKEPEKKLRAWIADYQRRYGVLPTLERVKSQFPNFVPIGGSRPLGDVLDTAVENRREEYARYIANQVLMTPNLSSAMGVLNEGLGVLNKPIGGFATLKDFDREKYFQNADKVLPLPYELINKVTGGVHSSDFVNIVARLGTGKTTIAQDIVRRWIEERPIDILFVSNEMGPAGIMQRFDGMLGRFNPLDLRRPEKHDAMRPHVARAEKRAKAIRGNVIVPESRLSTPREVAAQAQYMGVGAIVIDGMYLMRSDTYTSNKYERIAIVSNDLRQIGLDLGIPILCVNQFNRNAAQKDQLTVEDIGGSDAIGQDSSIVIGLKPGEGEGVAAPKVGKVVEAQLIKNRGGPTINTVLTINFETMEVVDESAASGWAAPV